MGSPDAGSVPGQRLLARADPSREDNEGGSPYAAAYDGEPEVKALLESRGGRLSAKQMANRARPKLMVPFYFSH